MQLIGEYVSLKKAGANWKARCPFHNEKSPSFMVHADKQIWHCFGCGKGGDIFSFVQEMEGLDFVEALKLLAKRAGVQIDTYKSETDQSLRNRVADITSKAAEFYHRILLELPAAEGARQYLLKRGITTQTIVEWQIGYIPDQWELLTKYFLKKGFGINDLVAAGLTIKRDDADSASGRGYYDRFRGRVMFPITDPHGSVVGFTGRVLVETENSGGKYVNTPQTVLYDKSRVLYGLAKAKNEIKTRGMVVLVEGQMDVIACHQAGMKNVVAASGTALTPDQIRLIKRYTTNISMAFDADSAGENAGKRGIAIAVEEGLNVKVIQIPKGFAKDADECIKKDPKVWFKAVAEAGEVMPWYFSLVLAKYNLGNPQQKQQAATELLAEIARIPHAVEKAEWIRRLSEQLGIDYSLLQEEVKKVKSKLPPAPRADAGATVKPVLVTLPLTTLEGLLQEWWSLVLKFPSLYRQVRDELKPEYMEATWYARLYELSEHVYTTDNQLSIDKLRDALNGDHGENMVDILLLRPSATGMDYTEPTAADELRTMAARIVVEWKKSRRYALQRALAEAEKRNDSAEVEKLFTELARLT